MRDGMDARLEAQRVGSAASGRPRSFAGLHDHDGQLRFDPKLPDGWTRLRFRLRVRGRSLEVELRPEDARDRLLSCEELELVDEGETIPLSADVPFRALAVREPRG